MVVWWSQLSGRALVAQTKRIPWLLPTLQFPLYISELTQSFATPEMLMKYTKMLKFVVVFFKWTVIWFLYRSWVCQDLPVYLPVFCNTREASEEADWALQCGSARGIAIPRVYHVETNHSGTGDQCPEAMGWPQCGLQRYCTYVCMSICMLNINECSLIAKCQDVSLLLWQRVSN